MGKLNFIGFLYIRQIGYIDKHNEDEDILEHIGTLYSNDKGLFDLDNQNQLNSDLSELYWGFNSCHLMQRNRYFHLSYQVFVISGQICNSSLK